MTSFSRGASYPSLHTDNPSRCVHGTITIHCTHYTLFIFLFFLPSVSNALTLMFVCTVSRLFIHSLRRNHTLLLGLAEAGPIVCVCVCVCERERDRERE